LIGQRDCGELLFVEVVEQFHGECGLYRRL
jgi:hypothetical protein